MKRIISIFLVVCAAVAMLSLTSCSKAAIDLTGKKNVYSDLADIIISPDEYDGKTIALNSTYTVIYNFNENKVTRHIIRVFDETGEKRLGLDLKYSGDYPAVGEKVTVIGTVSKDRYIEVDRFERAKKAADFELDTLDLSADELTKLIKDHRAEYFAGENYGKTIRIFGHLSVVKEGYSYLIGLDENGKFTWDIELYDKQDRLKALAKEGTEVNPVEIIGKLSTYEENNISYACIEVISVGVVESVFK